MDGNIELRINELITKTLENSISSEEFAELDRLIASDKDCAAYYISCMKYHDALNKARSLLRLPVDSKQSTDHLLLQQLAEYEATAPTVPIEKEIPESVLEPVMKRPQEQIVHNVKKPFIVLSLVSLAAMLLFIVSIQLIPVSPREVATLVDAMNAGYANETSAVPIGARIRTDQGLICQEQGIVKWLYDSNVEVVIEAPARYEFKSGEELQLYSGRVFAKVPPSGRGFTINTQLSKIVDLGTEFGILTAMDGDTEVHVFKGQTILSAGGQKNNLVLNLTAGNAGKICDNGATARQIQVQPNAFVRNIHSQTGFVWKGENCIPLTNLLAGTIFETSIHGVEIDPANGLYVQHGDFVSGMAERQAAARYQNITDSPFVDGIFIPQGQQPEIISSTQLTYQFPKTCGRFFFNLSDQKSVYDGMTKSKYPLTVTATSQADSSIFLHPNMGITFDLNKLRQKTPTIQIRQFRTRCGIAAATDEALKKVYGDGTIPEEERPSVDFVVLLDGKVCRTMPHIQMSSGIQEINIRIEPTNRFLTLAATDSNQSTKYDWFVLSDAVLEIAATE